MYNDPSGEFAFLLPVFAWIASKAAIIGTAALIGAGIGAAVYGIQAYITGNWSWGGFAKAVFGGALTGAVSGALGQVFSASGFWATVGNGALAGAGSGGINAVLNGQNFLEGLTKGAVIGGAVGAISWSINRMINTKKVRFYMEDSEANKLKPGTPVGKREYARELYEKEFGLQKGLNEKHIYNDASRLGGKMNESGVIEYVKNGKTIRALGVTEVRIDKTTGLPVGRIRMFLSDKAFASREQLAFVMQHELNHVRIANAGLSGASELSVNMGSLIDNVGHYHIQESGTRFLINNGWYNKNKYR